METDIMVSPVELKPLESQITAVCVEMPNETVLEIYNRVLFVARESKHLKEMMEDQIKLWIEHNGPLVVSETIRYCLGKEKTTKCTDVPAAVEALMNATGGDFKRFCDVLSSNAIKYGKAKKILAPDAYATLFKITEKTTLEGGPEKTLQKIDDQFMC